MPRNTRPTIRCGRCGRQCRSTEKLNGHARRAHDARPLVPGTDIPPINGWAFKQLTDRKIR